MKMRPGVPAPPAQATRYGLLTAAQVLTPGDETWGNGITWAPEQCGGSGAGPARCNLADPNTARTANRPPALVSSDAFYVWQTDVCSTMSGLGRDPAGRVRRQLEATQSFQIARELWVGAITQAATPAPVGPDDEPRSPYLADGDTVSITDTNGDVVPTVAALEQAALTCAQGRRVMLHVPVLSLALLTSPGGYVQRDPGGLLVTDMGSIVVADAGYPGTPPDAEIGGPGDDSTWVYASTLITIRLGTVEVFPDADTPAAVAQVTDRAANTITAWAQREAVYQLDPCCKFAAPLDSSRPTYMEV